MAGHLRVLVLDDDPADLELACRSLRRSFEQITIETASTSEEIKRSLQYLDYDAIITDYKMGSLSGLDVANKVNRLDQDLPVIMLTGTGTEEIAIEALRRGVRDYVIKSAEHINRLPAVLEAAIQRAATSRSNRLAASELRIRARQQASLAELGHKALSLHSAPLLCDEVVKTVQSTLGVPLVHLLEDAPGNRLIARYSSHTDGINGYKKNKLYFDNSSVEQFFEPHQQSLVVNDLSTFQRLRIPKALSIMQSLLAVEVPRASASRILIAYDDRPREFSRNDIHFVESVANLLATYLEKQTAQNERDRLFDASIDLIAIGDLDGKLTRVNPACEKLLGFTQREIAGSAFKQLVHEEEIEHTGQILWNLAKGEPIVGFEVRMNCRWGGFRWFSWQLVPDLESHQFFGIGRDITEKRELEQQLRHSMKMQAVGRLAGGLAHEFNNLLTVIVGNAEMAKINGPEEIGLLQDQILDAGQRAADLVQNLLTFSRKAELRRGPTKIAAVVDDLVAMVRDALPSDVQLIKEIPSDLPSALADSGLLYEALLNICMNSRDALQAIEGEKIIRFTAEAVDYAEEDLEVNPDRREGRFVKVTVSDNGSGMDAKTCQSAFDPFFTTKEVGQGTGLGLSTAYSIIQQHQGWFELESEPGKGTSVSLFIPQVKRVSPGESIEIPKPNSGVPLLLIVDDEAAVRSVATRMLEGAGYHVAVAADGAAAVEYFGEHSERIDAVLLDLAMPVLSGKECLVQMLAIQPDAKIIIVAGSHDQDQLEFVRSLGASGFVLKPFRLNELTSTIEQLLAPENGPTSEAE